MYSFYISKNILKTLLTLCPADSGFLGSVDVRHQQEIDDPASPYSKYTQQKPYLQGTPDQGKDHDYNADQNGDAGP